MVWIFVPLALFNILIAYTTVFPSYKRYNRITYRTLDIRTKQDNELLWSTDTNDDASLEPTEKEEVENKEDQI